MQQHSSSITLCRISCTVVCIRVSTLSKKHHTIFLHQPTANLQAVQASLSRQFPPIYWFFVTSPLEIRFYSDIKITSIILKFFILNTIQSFKACLRYCLLIFFFSPNDSRFSRFGRINGGVLIYEVMN